MGITCAIRLSIVLAALLLPQASWAEPCASTAAACSEWVVLAGGPSRSLVYRTYPLAVRNEAITGALVVVHGAGRDADNYFRHVLAGAYLAGALDETQIVSLRIASNDGMCRDMLAPNEVNWTCDGRDRWMAGGAAVGNTSLTSFDAADAVLRLLADRDVFPNLKSIVVAGHSAGGQFVSRYEMVNQVHGRLGLPIAYVVANPSSYAYVDPRRPTASAVPPEFAAGAPGFTPPPPQDARSPFVPFPDAQNCTTYDRWPYGMVDRTGYSARVTPDQIRQQLVARPTTYVLGALDILPLFGFDGSCAAMAQGPTRFARGLAFAKYVTEQYHAMHKTLVVANCGHNARCMFTTDSVLPLIFPEARGDK